MARGHRRWGGSVLVAAAVLAVLATLTGATPAGAAVPTNAAARPGGLPAGWTIANGPRGPVLTWTAAEPLPMGDALLEVRAGDQLLGIGVLSADGRAVSVVVRPVDLAQLTSGAETPSVWAAGRRLDTGTDGAGARAGDPGRTGPSDPVLGSAGAKGRLLAQDPGAPGPYRTRSGEYSLPGVRIAGLPAKVEMRAVVVSPRGAKGLRPLVLFLHGRHTTCYQGSADGDSTGDWPCPARWKQVPSYRGYLQTQRLLASQGYDTVSISANGINGQDWLLNDGGAAARSQLVRKHLRLWTEWSASATAHRAAPATVRSAPRADLGNVVLVGHSRGGEGVNRAALDSTIGTAVPWTIRGLVHIGSTAFGQNPAPGVPVVVLLPYCDGDVFDLQGQAYLDAARRSGQDHAFRSAVLVVGADHNFFNAEWTPGVAKAPAWDDWGDDTDKVCGTRSPTRLTAAEQRTVGATYTAAATALFARHRTTVLPLLDGRGARAASAGNARVLAHALGGRRTPLLIPTSTTALATSGSTQVRLCRTAEMDRVRRMCASWEEGGSPHFLAVFGVPGEPTRRAVDVSWEAKGGAVGIGAGRARDLSAASSVDLRVAVEPGTGTTRFGVRLVDAAGRRLVLGDRAVTGLPGTHDGFIGKVWAQDVRLSLSAARSSRIDLHRIVRVDVLPRSASGRMWLLDAWGWSGGLSSAAPYRLPRVDVGSLRMTEGSHDRTVQVPVTVTGKTSRASRLWLLVIDPNAFELNSFTITVPAGTKRLSVGVRVTGDRRDDYDRTDYLVAVEPAGGMVAGDYLGGVSVLDDDASPTLTVSPAVAEATEGAELVWELRLSKPSDVWISVPVTPVAPETARPPELNSADVPASWFTDKGYDVPRPAVPLSETGVWEFADFEPGMTSTSLTLPIKADARVEGDESVTFAVPADTGPVEGVDLGPDFRLVGVVHDG